MTIITTKFNPDKVGDNTYDYLLKMVAGINPTLTPECLKTLNLTTIYNYKSSSNEKHFSLEDIQVEDSTLLLVDGNKQYSLDLTPLVDEDDILEEYLKDILKEWMENRNYRY